MLNSSSIIQCNCFTEHPLHCSSIFQSMNCPVSTSTVGYRTSLDRMPATHSALANEKRDNSSEPSKCQRPERLAFGIENILYGTNRQRGR